MGDKIISKKADTPEVYMSASEGVIRFSGVCMPENPNLFFNEITEWVQQYLGEHPNNETLVEFELEYINSMTIKFLFNILNLFKTAQHHTTVNWKYKKNDLLMIEKGIEFEYITKLKINMIEL